MHTQFNRGLSFGGRFNSSRSTFGDETSPGFIALGRQGVRFEGQRTIQREGRSILEGLVRDNGRVGTESGEKRL